MKNKDIKDIDGFKKRIKMLYEYRMVDLNPVNDISVQVNEDENEIQPEPSIPPVQPPVAPVQPPVQQTPQPPVQQPEDNNTELISFFKNEMLS